MLKEFREKIDRSLKRELPGKRAHSLMSPRTEDGDLPRETDGCFREAGVLLLLFPDREGFSLVFIQRTVDEGPHSGQISFPGGGREKIDRDIFATAIREAEEEIGIDGESVEVLGTLTPLYVPPSNFCVFPIVGIYPEFPAFEKSPDEVEDIIIAPLDIILDPAIRGEKKMQTKRHRWTAPYYDISGFHIWGATAMITSEFIEILKECR